MEISGVTTVEPAYPSARAVAIRVHPHFARHGGIVPDVLTVEALVDAAFWASLRREEGFVPRISLAFVAPELVAQPLTFARSILLGSASLTKLAPAVVGPGIHLGISSVGGELRVWGATRNLPAYCFVLEVVAPGLLVIKESRGEETGKFVNIAVLQGEQVKVIDQGAATVPDCPELLTSLLGLESQFRPPDSVNLLIQLAVSMRSHGRGGLLLVVPANSQQWLESILQPITYMVEPPFSGLTQLMQEDTGERSRRRWQEALRRAVDGIGGLTAVDGAAVITDQYELLAFGAKIIRRPGRDQVARVIVTEPVEGTEASVLEPSEIGGTRHLSAAQLVHDQRDAIALVASQDGHFTVFAWSQCENMVHAHRIESLLL